jgi:hypothetical protein
MDEIGATPHLPIYERTRRVPVRLGPVAARIAAHDRDLASQPRRTAASILLNSRKVQAVLEVLDALAMSLRLVLHAKPSLHSTLPKPGFTCRRPMTSSWTRWTISSSHSFGSCAGRNIAAGAPRPPRSVRRAPPAPSTVRRAPSAVHRALCAVHRAPSAVRRAPSAVPQARAPNPVQLPPNGTRAPAEPASLTLAALDELSSRAAAA